MRTFTDAHGTEWTVFEVKRQLANATEQPRWTYLPEGYGEGWLCFESRFAKRRLMRFPERWREFNAGELESLLDAAQPVTRPGSSAPQRNTSSETGPSEAH